MAAVFIDGLAATPTREKELDAMNCPFPPTEASAYAWQMACCAVTLLFSLLSWIAGSR